MRTLLYIEDCEEDWLLLQHLLQRDCQLHRAHDLRETLALLNGPVEFDAVLVDLSLPDCLATQTLRALRETHPKLPAIVLTGNENPNIIGEAIISGADGYLFKHRDLKDAAFVAQAIETGIRRRYIQTKKDA
jgi:two-component system sensor histidine kinase DctS